MLTSCRCNNPLPSLSNNCQRCTGSLEARIRGIRTMTREPKPGSQYPLGWIANANPCVLVEHENPLVSEHFVTVAVYKNIMENPNEPGEDVSGGVFAEVTWTKADGYRLTCEATKLDSTRSRLKDFKTFGTYAAARSALLNWLPEGQRFVFGT
jgi:hypothetical protein